MKRTDRPSQPPPPPPPVTAEGLERAALSYLERFAASAASLRRVLMTKVERSVRDHQSDRAQAASLVESLITRYQDSGLLDDAVYAAARAESLRRRGASGRTIRQHLAARGVGPEVAAAALLQADLEARGGQEGDRGVGADSADDAAALALARRRRLGPFRVSDQQRQANRTRDLASLGRAGFSYETARRVIDGDGED